MGSFFIDKSEKTWSFLLVPLETKGCPIAIVPVNYFGPLYNKIAPKNRRYSHKFKNG